MSNIKTAQELYIDKFGVCPTIEKNIPLHSYKEVIWFTEILLSQHSTEIEELKAELEGAQMVASENEKGLFEYKAKAEKLMEALEESKDCHENAREISSEDDVYKLNNDGYSICDEALTSFRETKGTDNHISKEE